MGITILGIASLFFIGHFLQWFFVKTKIPDLLILIALGFIIGPSVLDFTKPDNLGQAGVVLSTVTLIIILYEGGLHLNATSLLKSSLPALLLSFLSFFLISGLTTLFLAPFFSIPTALLIGLGIGSTSSAVVFPLIKPLKLREETKTILSLESAFTDVLAIIAFLAVLDSILTQNYDLQNLALSFSTKPLVSIFLGVAFALIWSFLRKIFSHLVRMSFSTEAWSLLTYGVIELLDLNGAIGILFFGFTLANLNLLPSILSGFFQVNPIPKSEVSLLKEISFLLKTFFFIYLGMLIQLSALNIFILAILLTLLIFITRYVSVRVVFSTKRFSYFNALISMGMGPRGLACAVLATLPLQKGYVHGEFIQNLIFYIILVSIISTSLFVIFGQKAFFKKIFSPFFEAYLKEDSTTVKKNMT
ncbi:MAG: cation:proton antiporter [Bdellovibrionales bacterium]|nr:cation:proton antiporter [Bdellovibrionales bacterium]